MLKTEQRIVCADCYIYIGTGDASHFDGAYAGSRCEERHKECSEGLDKLVSEAPPNSYVGVSFGEFPRPPHITNCECCGIIFYYDDDVYAAEVNTIVKDVS